MWTRRLLLATIVAACAMSLPRHAPHSWSSAMTGTTQVAAHTLR